MAQIGHDLRTPLNAIIGFSDIMQRELLGPIGTERYQDYAGHIRDSGFALFKAIEDTLALTSLLAEPGADRTARTALDKALREAAAFTLPDAEARRVSVVFRDVAGIAIVGDPKALQQGLVNIVQAALRRTAYGGSLEIGCVADGRAALITLTPTSTGEPASRRSPGNPVDDRLPMAIARALVGLLHGRLVEHESDNCSIEVSLPTA